MTPRTMVAGLCAGWLLCPTVARADVVLDWNEIMVAAVADLPPPHMNRFAAITHVAIFEAVNAVTGEHTAYSGAGTPARGASADAAAVAAAHRVLRQYFPDRAASLTPRWPARWPGSRMGRRRSPASRSARRRRSA